MDHSIVQLYPAIYLSERFLVPKAAGTIKPPKDMKWIEGQADDEIEYAPVQHSVFRARGHDVLDAAAVTAIAGFAIITLRVAAWPGLISFSYIDLRCPAVPLLIGNLFGLILVVLGIIWWRCREIK